MKKKILIFAIVLITIFAAVSCSYTFDAIARVYVRNGGSAATDALVYLFDTEKNANIGYNILNGNDERNIYDYTYRNSDPFSTDISGYATLPIRWVTSSPSDGKDNDQRYFWMIATDGTNVSEPVRQTIYSGYGSSCNPIDLV